MSTEKHGRLATPPGSSPTVEPLAGLKASPSIPIASAPFCKDCVHCKSDRWEFFLVILPIFWPMLPRLLADSRKDAKCRIYFEEETSSNYYVVSGDDRDKPKRRIGLCVSFRRDNYDGTACGPQGRFFSRRIALWTRLKSAFGFVGAMRS
jgi:hypothetical protein